MSMVRKRPHDEYALSLLAGEMIGLFASYLDERCRPMPAQRAREADACALDIGGTLTPAQYAEAVAIFIRERGWEIQSQLLTDSITFTCMKCPFGEGIKRAPSYCHLIGASLWWGAARYFGHGKVVFKRRIAVGDDHCDIRVYLKDTTEAESEAGIAHLSALSSSLESGDANVPANEMVRRLKERVRVLEHKIEELEDALEDRKVIEKAKGILMERLTLTEIEAMRRLQKKSQSRNKKLAEIARVISRPVRLSEGTGIHMRYRHHGRRH